MFTSYGLTNVNNSCRWWIVSQIHGAGMGFAWLFMTFVMGFATIFFSGNEPQRTARRCK